MSKNKRGFIIAVSGVIVGIVIDKLWLSSIVNFIISNITSKKLTGNIFDFIGNILIALTSAGIAWFISSRDKKEIKEKNIRDSIMTLKLMKIEISIHKAKLTNLIEQDRIEYRQCTDDIKKLNTDVWNKNFNKLIISDQLFEKFYKYYLALSELSFLNEDELLEKEKTYLKQHINKSEQAIEKISKEIENNSPTPD